MQNLWLWWTPMQRKCTTSKSSWNRKCRFCGWLTFDLLIFDLRYLTSKRLTFLDSIYNLQLRVKSIKSCMTHKRETSTIGEFQWVNFNRPFWFSIGLSLFMWLNLTFDKIKTKKSQNFLRHNYLLVCAKLSLAESLTQMGRVWFRSFNVIT